MFTNVLYGQKYSEIKYCTYNFAQQKNTHKIKKDKNL